jgi:tetratricopeptide (TPR) repeat protein
MRLAPLAFSALALVPTLGACTKRESPPPPATVADAGPSGAATRDGGAGRSFGDAGAKATKPALTPAQRKTVLAALDAGRKKARAKDYAGALADYDRALAIAPDDGRVLAEVGYAALLGGDLARATDANKRALKSVHDKNLRAQILYNAGRVAEAKNDKDAARAAYAESLALRENAEVRKRLESVGGAAPPAMPCTAGASTPETLCTCLVAPDVVLPHDPSEPMECRVLPESLQLGTPRLSILRVGTQRENEVHYLLLARDGGILRPVAELGTDFEPGAFGVHDSATIGKGEVRPAGKRSVVVVASTQNDVDMNLAGLEACTNQEKRETVCALGEGERLTRCVTVTMEREGGCGPGVEPDPDDADAKEMLASVDKSAWGKTKATSTWSVAEDGTLVVKEGAGKTTAYPLF